MCLSLRNTIKHRLQPLLEDRMKWNRSHRLLFLILRVQAFNSSLKAWEDWAERSLH